MRPNRLAIRPLTDPRVLAELAADAEADGWRMVSRLIAEWGDGSNRFAAPGERAYVAVWADGQPVAVGGLNVDPFAHDPMVGRIRRLYVARAQRRRGVASALMQRLSVEADGYFAVLRLRTDDAEASAFYEARGFTRVGGDRNCTHWRQVAVQGMTTKKFG
jgi:ribosomal protein S18 acetylase RimI-like enzyme